jgi:hypothetical protein
MDDQKPDVPASCILLAATVDGVLRLYRLANFKQEQGLAREPKQMPAGLPPQLLMALAAAQQALLEEVGGRLGCRQQPCWFGLVLNTRQQLEEASRSCAACMHM